MKNCLTLLLLLVSLTTFGQNLDECGNDDNPKLSQAESEFLNSYFDDKMFDFTGKKVIFVTQERAQSIETKSNYFDQVKQYNKQDSKVMNWVVTLNEQEKIDSGGYDIIICYWVKLLTKGRKRRIIKKVGKNQ
ncbi:hypothetical protein WAF17_15900 [Bernardetia sp. ABR2-2B]|uniref:hypothetical protein n=1 Tax=Bernardetia sp. ABR2-2B TaxID=3127472 RepID=UPI0030D3E807